MRTRRKTLKRNFEKDKVSGTRKKNWVQIYFLLCSFYFLLLTFPAQASRLQTWRLDANRGQLEFSTDGGVQPKAQLMTGPTRLVIDLPGVKFGRRQVTRSYTGAIRSVRVGQFERGMTRIVVEYAPGYTVDPNQIRFRGVTANQWSVQLPTPQGGEVASSSLVASDPPAMLSPSSSSPLASAKAQIRGVQPTTDGFFIRMSGDQPDVRSLRSSDRRQMFIDLYGASISPAFPLNQRDVAVNRNGVNRLQVSQFQASPPVVRVTLGLDPNSPNWQARASSFGSMVLLPQTGTAQNPTSEPSQNQTATVQAVELDNNQLMIRADQPISYSSGWDRPTGAYRILIPAAKLADNVKGPQLSAGSPLLQVRLRQEGNDVAVLMTPAAGIRIGDITQSNREQVALSLRRSGLFPPNMGSVPPSSPGLPPAANPRPFIPPANGRQVIVVDPGHGGPDPGAVGIGGLRETDIVLEVGRQVQAILEQNGVQVVMTRTGEYDVGLQPRVDTAQRANATAFVSLHANAISMSRPDINGIETYYFNSGLELARVLHRSMLQATGARDRRVRRSRFYVLRRTSMPSVLLEMGYVTGREDAPRLASSDYRRILADAIARGILEYLGRR
jgi:N-acetylmuramoyl-L-alanine amidase